MIVVPATKEVFGKAMKEGLLKIFSDAGAFVSNDNPYSESLFRTLKYCPQWPAQGFANLEAARMWVRNFIVLYNNEHRHSRIRFVTPAQRHRGEDKVILAKRDALYRAAKAEYPERWAGETRNWSPIGVVILNPERPVTESRKAA